MAKTRAQTPKPAHGGGNVAQKAAAVAKTVAGLRKARHRGLPKIDGQFTFAMAAYNLVRLPKLMAVAA